MIDRRDAADPADVLLVEPSDERARSARDRLSGGRSRATTVHAVSDGDEALAFLEGRDEHADAPTPSLVVLRLDLPDSGPDGLGVLERTAQRRELARIPVVATVDESTDAVVGDAYDRGANAVVSTPSDSEAFLETIGLIAQFWLATARLPNRIDRL